MVSSPLTNYWEYKPITVQCPCGITMPATEAGAHGFAHWDDLTNDD